VERSRPSFWGRLRPFSSLVANFGTEWLRPFFVWLKEWDLKWMVVFTPLVGSTCHRFGVQWVPHVIHTVFILIPTPFSKKTSSHAMDPAGISSDRELRELRCGPEHPPAASSSQPRAASSADCGPEHHRPRAASSAQPPATHSARPRATHSAGRLPHALTGCLLRTPRALPGCLLRALPPSCVWSRLASSSSHRGSKLID
jgi:hypothetical protein